MSAKTAGKPPRSQSEVLDHTWSGEVLPDAEGRVPARATLDKMINNFRREASQHLSKFLELKELEQSGRLGFFEVRENRQARAKEYALYIKWKRRVFELSQLSLPFERPPKQP